MAVCPRTPPLMIRPSITPHARTASREAVSKEGSEIYRVTMKTYILNDCLLSVICQRPVLLFQYRRSAESEARDDRG